MPVSFLVDSAEQLNMKGVFLHVLGDALGSVVVIISAVIYMTVPPVCVETVKDAGFMGLQDNGTCVGGEMMSPTWINYVDPSLRYTYIIFTHTQCILIIYYIVPVLSQEF